MQMTEDATNMPEAEAEEQDEHMSKSMMTEEDAARIAEIMMKMQKPDLLRIEARMESIENIVN
eukprot:1768855-Heterocapsa_arctica.AAC.1